MNDANAFLMTPSSRVAQFKNIGDSITGVIDSMQVVQQTDRQTGVPMTWNDGSPRNQLLVVLYTNERVDEEDEGARRVYIRGQMKNAVQAAVRAAGRSGLGIGDTLSIQYYANGEPSPGYDAPKLYRATYEPR